MRFLNESHALNFQNLILVDDTHPSDHERFSLFYILGSDENLFLKRAHIYDFKEHAIRPEILTEPKVDLCSSQKSLVRLAFNLYNGFEDEYTNPRDLLKNLDSENGFVAMQAMMLNFERVPEIERITNVIEEGEDYEIEFDF